MDYPHVRASTVCPLCRGVERAAWWPAGPVTGRGTCATGYAEAESMTERDEARLSEAGTPAIL